MVYLGCMWGFDQDARISEYTTPERGGVDHCVRAGDLVFDVVCEDGVIQITGGCAEFDWLGSIVTGCWVRSTSHKVGAIVKASYSGPPKIRVLSGYS